MGTKVPIPSGHPPTDPVAVDRVGASRPARVRRAYLDNLKVVLVTGVILGHAFITYGDIGSWAYRETSTNDVFNIVAAVVVSLRSLFAMGLFFLIAGLLTPGPAQRKGPFAGGPTWQAALNRARSPHLSTRVPCRVSHWAAPPASRSSPSCGRPDLSHVSAVLGEFRLPGTEDPATPG